MELPNFENEPFLDFSDPSVREGITKNITKLRESYIGTTYPLIIGGSRAMTRPKIIRRNPANLSEVVGRVCAASTTEVDEAISVIKNSTDADRWRRASFAHKADIMRKAADKIREQKYFFIALMALEVGKGFVESDAEVAEAIDLVNYYAQYAPFLEKLQEATLRSPKGERNTGKYIPVGNPAIAASIQPWNFPLAISAGPTAAALVAGHSVLYKPAEQSSVIGFFLSRCFYEAGVPGDVLHYLPGHGEEIGSYMVRHPAIGLIAFTGSAEVRNHIQKQAGNKRLAALESGGKNAIIVTDDADCDVAVPGVANSAFGFQGQKCSACSRLIVVDSNGDFYQMLTKRLADRVRCMPIGPPEDPANKVGPLIGQEAYDKVEMYRRAAKSLSVIAEGYVPEYLKRQGYFVPPLIVEGASPADSVARDEIFGPVLVVFRVNTPEEAVQLANDTQYALTAGIFSRNRRDIEYFTEAVSAGNIYINRSITGAIPGRQPFGGYKMSGNSSKAGGWDYLLNFVDRVNITEHAMRRGAVLEE